MGCCYQFQQTNEQKTLWAAWANQGGHLIALVAHTLYDKKGLKVATPRPISWGVQSHYCCLACSLIYVHMNTTTYSPQNIWACQRQHCWRIPGTNAKQTNRDMWASSVCMFFLDSCSSEFHSMSFSICARIRVVKPPHTLPVSNFNVTLHRACICLCLHVEHVCHTKQN